MTIEAAQRMPPAVRLRYPSAGSTGWLTLRWQELPEKRHWQRIVNEVGRKHRIPPPSLVGPRRLWSIVAARQECYYRIRNEVRINGKPPAWQTIAGWMGRTNHVCALTGARRHAAAQTRPG